MSFFKHRKITHSAEQIDFRAKVKEILKEEKDFRSLYDYDVVASLNEKEKEDYLYDILRDYLRVKADLLNEKRIKEIS